MAKAALSVSNPVTSNLYSHSGAPSGATSKTRLSCSAVRAFRLGHLPCSKEILPIGVRTSRSGERRICALGEFLLDEFARTGIEHVYMIVDPAKSDIVEIEDYRTPEGHGMLKVWMSHGDKVVELPPGFKLMASTERKGNPFASVPRNARGCGVFRWSLSGASRHNGSCLRLQERPASGLMANRNAVRRTEVAA